MGTTKRFTTGFAMLAGISRLALGVSLGLLPSCAFDDSQANDPAASEDSSLDGEETSSQAVCTTGRFQCLSHIRTVGTERRIVSRAAAPVGFGPPDLQAAYKIDPTKLATATKPTIAIVDAYGYPNLEADLKVYRTQYGLPECSVANNCLKIVNQQGLATPLPVPPPAGDDWTIETALDVDMASAACPLCNILVVQATDDQGDGLNIAQNTAVSLGATVISDSWGQSEQAGMNAMFAMSDLTYFNHPNIAIFVASGDAGYNSTIEPAGRPTGPGYPATSAYTIAVGATHLVKDLSTRGWTETAWAVTKLANGTSDPNRGAGGSACSLSIPKPAYQTASPCAFKATADIAAVGDPATGVAVYNTTAAPAGSNPGWTSVGGTSASSPFVAGIFAATGNGAQTSGAFVASKASKLYDVVAGVNGSCGAQTLLCNAAAGWDGPTGFGTPNAAARMVPPGATGGGGSGTGSGTGSGGGSGDDSQDVTGGCSTGGGNAGAGLLLGLAMLGFRRRRA
jgi:hypothetical protein